MVSGNALAFAVLAPLALLVAWYLSPLSGAVFFAMAWASWFALRPFCRNVLDLPFVFLDLWVAIAQAVATLALRGGKPRYPEWTPALEIIQTVANRVMTKYGALLALPANAQALRHLSGVLGKLEARASCQEHATQVTPVIVNGLEHLWIRASNKSSSEGTDTYTVLYYHGGGYAIMCPAFYLTVGNRIRHSLLCALRSSGDSTIQVDVLLANYRKAPEVQFPVPQQDALFMYEYLCDDQRISPEKLIVAGDSAGAGLVLSTLMRLRDGKATKQKLPLCALLSFPLADMTNDPDPTRGKDCILSRQFMRATIEAMLPTWKENDPAKWGDVSSVHCDLKGLPPALIQVGTADYLYQDSIKLFEKVQKDTTKWELQVFPNMLHVFSSLPPQIVPDSERAMMQMGQFVAKQIQNK